MTLILAAILFSNSQIDPASSDANYPDVPENHWAYDFMKRCKADGFLPDYSELLRGNRPWTRGEFGRDIVHVVMNMTEHLNRNEKWISQPGGELSRSSTKSELKMPELAEMENLIPTLGRLTDTFSKNLPDFVDAERLKAAESEMDGRLATFISNAKNP